LFSYHEYFYYIHKYFGNETSNYIWSDMHGSLGGAVAIFFEGLAQMCVFFFFFFFFF
jgi:hypothetical protein